MGLTNDELIGRHQTGERLDRLRRLRVPTGNTTAVNLDDDTNKAALDQYRSVNAAAKALGVPRPAPGLGGHELHALQRIDLRLCAVERADTLMACTPLTASSTICHCATPPSPPRTSTPSATAS